MLARKGARPRWRGQLRIQVFKGTEVTLRLPRITSDPRQMGGMPCIRGLRIPVATVVSMVANGMHENEILSAYPALEHDDIQEALRFAADAVRESVLPLTVPQVL